MGDPNRTEMYSCAICGFESKWEDEDPIHGEIWVCEKCGKVFCKKCFVDKYGKGKYMEMMQNYEIVYCPECYSRKNHESR